MTNDLRALSKIRILLYALVSWASLVREYEQAIVLVVLIVANLLTDILDEIRRKS